MWQKISQSDAKNNNKYVMRRKIGKLFVIFHQQKEAGACEVNKGKVY